MHKLRISSTSVQTDLWIIDSSSSFCPLSQICPRCWGQSATSHQSFWDRLWLRGNTNISTLHPMVRACRRSWKKRWQTGVIWVGERIWLTCNLSPNLSVCVSGFTLSSSDYREKEDMYDEIIRLKKVKLNKNEHVVAKWEIALQPESSGWIDDVSKHLCPPEVALICLQSDSDLTPQNLHMHSPHVSLLFSSVSPGAEVWQPEDESQTTPPRGR